MAMDGREGGYIKLHRQVGSSALWLSLSAEQRAVMIQLLFMANWKPAKARWQEHWYEVGRGELSHSLSTIAKASKVSVKVVRSTLVALMADDTEVGGNGPFVTERYPIPGTGPGTGPRILTIVNYCKYQDVPDDEGTGPGTAGARVGHGSGTGGAQREEGEEGKKEKKEASGFRRLQDSLVAAFLEIRGTKYLWHGAKDAEALKRLMASASADEIVARWRSGLTSKDKFKNCSTVAQLWSKWNDLAGEGDAHDAECRRLIKDAELELASGPDGRDRPRDQPRPKDTPPPPHVPATREALRAATGNLLGDWGQAGELQDGAPVEHGAQPGAERRAGPVR